MTKDDVARSVSRGDLDVFTFRGDDARLYRMVRLADVERVSRNPLTLKGMARALDRMLRQQQKDTPGTATRRRAA